MPGPDDLRQNVEERLALGNEDQSFEVKGGLDLNDRAHCAKVARAAMAMGNLRDGGLICIGIDESQMREMLPGLDDNAYEAWSDYDNISDALARYCDPPVSFTRHPMTLTNGKKVVVLKVAQFDGVPHVCRRDLPGELRAGALYVRPRGKPESVPIPSVTAMRDLLDLAITSGVRDFVRRAGQAGIPLTAAVTQEDVDREAYLAEREQAWGVASQVMNFIHARGHTEVSVRPGTFDAQRLNPAKLESFIVNNTVRLRGWPVPFTDHRIGLIRYPNAVGQDIEAAVVPHCEAWRMCGSGQFLQHRVLSSDMRDFDQPQPTSPTASGVVIVWDILFYLVEVAEFGARMATALDLERVTFDVTLDGIANRELVSGDSQRALNGTYKIHADQLRADVTVPTTRLVAEPRQVGVELAQALLQHFGLGVPDQVLYGWQAETLDG